MGNFELTFIQSSLEDYNTFYNMYKNLCYSAEYESFSRIPDIIDYDSFIKSLGRSNFFFIILDGQKIGYIILDTFLNGICQIKEMCIIPECQKHGLGKAAIEYLVAVLKENDSLTELKVISATEVTDIFYQKCGFSNLYNNVYIKHLL